jgi:hypothetical protein
LKRMQHLRHAFGVHCFHLTDAWTKARRDKSHGKKAGEQTVVTRHWTHTCCHCGKEKTSQVFGEVGAMYHEEAVRSLEKEG